VEEAADVLRISRNTAYTLARLWRESGGTQGLPVIELGRNLRVPRACLQRLLNGSPRTGVGGDGVTALASAMREGGTIC
jgi:transposase